MVIILFINNVFKNNCDKRNTWIEYSVSKIWDETMYGRFCWNSKFYCLIFVVRRSKTRGWSAHNVSKIKQTNITLITEKNFTKNDIEKHEQKYDRIQASFVHRITEIMADCFFDMTRFVFVTPVSINHWTRKNNNF